MARSFDAPQMVVPLAARNTSGNSDPIDVSGVDEMSVFLTVTAASGTSPSMSLAVHWSDDGVVWYGHDPADVISATTGIASKVKEFTVKAPLMRLAWTLTGTAPSFTFSGRLYLH